MFSSRYRQIEHLAIPIFAAVEAADGQTYVSNHDGVFLLEGREFRRIWKDDVPPYFAVHRLHADPWGGVYFANRDSDKLFRKPPGDEAFHEVLHLNGVTRGFDFHAPSGQLLLGRYSQSGPAQVLTSSDGESWSIHWEWNAKHIHDLRVNPHNDRIYIAIGEGDPEKTDDSHCLFCSTDGSNTKKVFKPHGTRPLIFPINFYHETVIAGTDHFEGGNFICALVASGGDMLTPKRLFDIPHQDSPRRPAPFPYFMEWFDGSLFIGVRGKDVSFLLETRDLRSCRIVEENRTRSIALSYIGASRGTPGSKSLIVSGPQGRRLSATGGQPTDAVPDIAIDGGQRMEQDHMEEEGSWGLGIERRIQELLEEHDPKLKEELSKGYFYRANPLFYNKVHMRETLAFILSRDFPRNSRVLDYGTGTGQFLLYLRQFGFKNLHGWEQNQRWLNAAKYLFENLAETDSVEFRKVERPAIYDLNTEGGTFDLITMFGLIYGHGIDVPSTLKSVSRALNKGGFFVANDKTYEPADMRSWINEAGMRLVRKLTIEGAAAIENHIYFCSKA